MCELICWCTEMFFYLFCIFLFYTCGHYSKKHKRLASPEQAKTGKTETESNASELKRTIATLDVCHQKKNPTFPL